MCNFFLDSFFKDVGRFPKFFLLVHLLNFFLSQLTDAAGSFNSELNSGFFAAFSERTAARLDFHMVHFSTRH